MFWDFAAWSRFDMLSTFADHKILKIFHQILRMFNKILQFLFLLLCLFSQKVHAKRSNRLQSFQSAWASWAIRQDGVRIRSFMSVKLVENCIWCLSHCLYACHACCVLNCCMMCIIGKKNNNHSPNYYNHIVSSVGPLYTIMYGVVDQLRAHYMCFLVFVMLLVEFRFILNFLSIL